jgi:metal-responsive CopG/Arc/MetJ family transcriptional regulator
MHTPPAFTRTNDKTNQIRVRINDNLLANLEALSKATGMKQSELIRDAIQSLYLDHLQMQP